MPGDIVHGTSYQIAFNIRQVCDPPLFVAWADGHASRRKDMAFDHVEVLGPLAHQKFLLELADWQDHLPSYPLFRDVRTAARPTEPIRREDTYVLEPLGAIWTQHIIDDWVEFQGKKISSTTATPRIRPQTVVDERMRLEYSLRMPDRMCPPGTPARPQPADPVVKGKGKGTATSSYRAASSTHRGARAGASSSGSQGYQRPDSQSWTSHSWSQSPWRR